MRFRRHVRPAARGVWHLGVVVVDQTGGAGCDGCPTSAMAETWGVAPPHAQVALQAAAAAFRRCSASFDRALSAPYSSFSVTFSNVAAFGLPSCLAQATSVP